MAARTESFYATGRRKTAIARVWLSPGNGTIKINKRDIDNYFGRATSKMVIRST
jgi:small subunit ribosomal protein S9